MPGRHDRGRQGGRGDHRPDEPRLELADGLRWIARRVKPSRRHLRNLTMTRRRPAGSTPSPARTSRTPGSPASRQPPPPVHRRGPFGEHAVERPPASAPPRPTGPAEPPLEDLAVNCAWPTAGVAAVLTAWTRLLGCCDDERTPRRRPGARSATGSGTSPPASPPRPASAPCRSARLALEGRVPPCRQRPGLPAPA